MADREITEQDWADVQVIWDYHQLGHELRPVSAAIALGSFDLGVATCAASLFKDGYFPVLVFTGATSTTTIDRFPRGEAVEYRDHALSLGVPDEAILVEPRAANTGQNIEFSRQVLRQHDVEADSVMLISMPYMQRRAYATCVKQWPEVEVVCASEPVTLADYIAGIGDPRKTIDELVGDLQRIWRHAAAGFTIEQDVPVPVMAAYNRLVNAGFVSKLLP
ncbi:YdcF family protein [Amycolatopsis sp. 195334CR]|uniref:YdcF family protein n=1 Tax=Amycolatopsis sp. 195334CR TaxID=2814588 RepID=UPI0027DE500B|nr:YdcF family protein [Amycolatopsis sp. 195334CR]